MRSAAPRVAFFTDCFHEINGVALTSRQFQDFAQRRGTPFFSVHAGPSNHAARNGAMTVYEWKRGPLCLGLDADLSFDLLFPRRLQSLRAALEQFRPDLVHVTSPGDCGILGTILAWQLGVPLVASWHTNVHEFAGRRLERLLHWLPDALRGKTCAAAERKSLEYTLRFYQLARLILAPNQDLIRMIRARTGRPCLPMRRGIDTGLFHPGRRQRNDDAFVLGYVGRVKPEKNVRLLARIEKELMEAGVENYRFLVVGQGCELDWLRKNLRRAEFTGVLRGEELARAYANMDLFVFPSRTDTFGNVVQEALASGVPAIVTSDGGPRFLVREGETGCVAATDEQFCRDAVELAKNRARHERLREQVLQASPLASWDQVFESVYAAYELCLPPGLSTAPAQIPDATPVPTPN